jgi:cyanate permease
MDSSCDGVNNGRRGRHGAGRVQAPATIPAGDAMSDRPADGYRVYGYRWVVLAVVMLINLAIQILWIGYSSITSSAADYYGVSEFKIGLLSMAFMIAFIPLSLPVAWVIDTKGIRVAIGTAGVLMGVCGIGRGLAGDNFALVMLFTVGIAIAQPFLLNSWTKVPAVWFAPGQRATAVGLTTLASFLGIAAGMALSPILTGSLSIATTQLLYGAFAAVCAVLVLVLLRSRPATPPCPPGMDERALMLDGLRSAIRVKPFLVMLGVAFVVMGIFNGVATWVEQIVRPRGFSADDAGILGALMLVAGVIGAVVLPALSDRRRKRVPFLVLALLLTIPGVVGLAFATSTWLLFVSAAELGFFVIAVLPVGMQYACEVTYPTPEGTSNGLIQLCGQVSVVFVYIMSAMKSGSGSFTSSLMLAIGLLVVSAAVVSRLKEPRETAASVDTAAGTTDQSEAMPTDPAGELPDVRRNQAPS